MLQGAPTTKGCGLVTLGSNDEAAAAIDALDSKHIWDGMEAPMVSRQQGFGFRSGILGF
jgi:hypothetical protein